MLIRIRRIKSIPEPVILLTFFRKSLR